MATRSERVVESDATEPQYLGRYQLDGRLGRGGMGAVYRARDRASGEVVALKTLESPVPMARELFEREYQTLSSLAHPSLARTLDYGVSDDGRRYFAMELIDGQDLYKLAPLPWPVLCRHLSDVAAVLSMLHQRGLAHRDVSPRNIRIDSRGQARLLDFGALSPFGRSDEIVGTPACVAPEVLRREPIDARSDLFSLGVTAYIALTGEKPFVIRTLEEALEAHEVTPVSPGELVAGLPPALDELILTMIRVGPRHRPDSAADVIERLGALMVAEEARESSPPHDQFQSPPMVGREREVKQLKQYVAAAERGEGTALVIEGASRIGKTRLLETLLVHARVMGATTVQVDGGGFGPPGVPYHQLVHALLAAAPDEATACLAGEPLVKALASGPGRTPFGDSTMSHIHEAHGDLQAAVVRWVCAVSRSRPLVLVVDEAQQLDTASSSVIFALAHALPANRILLAVATTSDAPLHPTLERVTRLSARIKLRRLSSRAIDELVEALFGQVAHRARLARWVEAVSGGNPGQCVDLLEALVRRRVIRWLSGSWTLPKELPQERLPGSVEEALVGVLSDLSDQAKELAQLTALQQTRVSLALACRLVKDRTAEEVRQICQMLCAKGVFLDTPTGYRVAHEGYRRALLEGLSPTVTARLHRSVGESLLAEAGYSSDLAIDRVGQLTPEACNACLRAGWHLLRGGDKERGRQLLRTMAILLTYGGEGLADAVPALEDALVAYREDGRSIYEMYTLMVPVALAGAYLEPRLVYQYGLPMAGNGLSNAGLDAAQRLRRFLPRRLALYGGLALAFVRYRLTSRRVLTRTFRELILGVIGLTAATMGAFSALTDGVESSRLLARMRPLGWFPKLHPARIAFEMLVALSDSANGRYGEAIQRGREVVERLSRPELAEMLPPEALRQFQVGVQLLVGSLDCYRSDDRALDSVARLEPVDSPMARESAAGIRAVYHVNRGEMKLFVQERERVDVLAAQGGSPWRQDVIMPRALWWVEALCEDMLGLKRSIRQLESIAADHSCLERAHAAAHSCYLAERGLADQAIARYGAILKSAANVPGVLTKRYAGAYARVLRQSGNPHAARELCQDVLAAMPDGEREYVCLYFGLQLELGRALAACGDLEVAAAYHDQLCAEQVGHNNPLLHALAHLARVEVAVAQGDKVAYAEHMQRAEPHISATDYAALFGLAQRLRARARACGLKSDASELSVNRRGPLGGTCDSIGRAIAACRGAAERQQVALDVVIERSRAAAGYLYLLDQDGLRFAAPRHGVEPPEALLEELQQRTAAWAPNEVHMSDGDSTQTVVDARVKADAIAGFEARIGSAYRVLYITTRREHSEQLIGLAALVEGASPLRGVPRPIIEAIADSFYDAGDATVLAGSS